MTASDWPELVGMTERAAALYLSQHGYLLRVVSREGVPTIITADHIADRVNVASVNGRVKSVVGKG